jgi:hypothetical protein
MISIVPPLGEACTSIPRGDVKTCCAGNPNMLGNLNSKKIEEILHGPVLQEIRSNLRQGQPHAYCAIVCNENAWATKAKEPGTTR